MRKLIVSLLSLLVALVGLAVIPQPALAATSTVYAAGAAATNLPTESRWAGAQDYPYICSWNAQGQYVTFTFSVTTAGSTGLTLRYSAGSGAASREIDVDGATTVANEALPSTGSWNSWSTVTLTQTLAAGTHTLKIWFNSPNGSHQYVNLDNLTVSQSS